MAQPEYPPGSCSVTSILAPVMIVVGIVVGFRIFGILGAIVGAFLGVPLTIVPVALIVTCVYVHEKWSERRQRP